MGFRRKPPVPRMHCPSWGLETHAHTLPLFLLSKPHGLSALLNSSWHHHNGSIVIFCKMPLFWMFTVEVTPLCHFVPSSTQLEALSADEVVFWRAYSASALFRSCPALACCPRYFPCRWRFPASIFFSAPKVSPSCIKTSHISASKFCRLFLGALLHSCAGLLYLFRHNAV